MPTERFALGNQPSAQHLHLLARPMITTPEEGPQWADLGIQMPVRADQSFGHLADKTLATKFRQTSRRRYSARYQRGDNTRPPLERFLPGLPALHQRKNPTPCSSKFSHSGSLL